MTLAGRGVKLGESRMFPSVSAGNLSCAMNSPLMKALLNLPQLSARIINRALAPFSAPLTRGIPDSTQRIDCSRLKMGKTHEYASLRMAATLRQGAAAVTGLSPLSALRITELVSEVVQNVVHLHQSRRSAQQSE